ncbi:hypothetical protein OG900_00300 [Streptomyces sp. NBC_00433]
MTTAAERHADHDLFIDTVRGLCQDPGARRAISRSRGRGLSHCADAHSYLAEHVFRHPIRKYAPRAHYTVAALIAATSTPHTPDQPPPNTPCTPRPPQAHHHRSPRRHHRAPTRTPAPPQAPPAARQTPPPAPLLPDRPVVPPAGPRQPAPHGMPGTAAPTWAAPSPRPSCAAPSHTTAPPAG